MNLRRHQLLAGVRKDSKILEVGPLANPIAPRNEGWNSFTIDHANTVELKYKYRDDPNVNCDQIVDVDFLTGAESFIEHIPNEHIGTFDFCIASHVLEHVPDTIRFINSMMALLNDTGCCIFVLPDKTKCFDIFKPLTLTSDILEAYRERRLVHSRKTRWDQSAYSVFSGNAPAWAAKPNHSLRLVNPSLGDAHQSYLSDDLGYHDCHAIYCTPSSFELLLLELNMLDYINVNIVSISETVGIEFIVKLKKSSDNRTQDFAVRRLQLLEESYTSGTIDVNNNLLNNSPVSMKRELGQIRTSARLIVRGLIGYIRVTFESVFHAFIH